MAKTRRSGKSSQKSQNRQQKQPETDIRSAPVPDLKGRAKPGDRQAENIIDTIEME